MAIKIHIFGRQLTQPEVNQLLTDYYPYVYAVANKFYAPQIGDDVKENIAFKALQRGLQTYDPDKGVKFSSYIYMLVMNDLKSEYARVKKLPISVRDVPDRNDERKDIFEFISDYKALEENDTEFHGQLTKGLEERLTDRQKTILDMLMSPQVYADKYNQEYKPEKPLKKLNYDAMGVMLGVSIATITYEVKKIQAATQDILHKLESR